MRSEFITKETLVRWHKENLQDFGNNLEEFKKLVTHHDVDQEIEEERWTVWTEIGFFQLHPCMNVTWEEEAHVQLTERQKEIIREYFEPYGIGRPFYNSEIEEGYR